MKKIISTALVAVIIAGVFAGCVGEDKNSTSDIPKSSGSSSQAEQTTSEIDHSEYYEITIYGDGVDPKYEAMQENNSFHKALKEKFNFGVKFLRIPGDVTEYASLRLAGGDYSEVIRLNDSKLIKSYIEAGAIVELGPLIEKYGPNFKQRNNENINAWKMMTTMNDDKIWTYSTWEPDRSAGISKPKLEFVMRSDVLEQQNYPEVTTEKDFLNVLEKGLKDNPTTDGKPTLGLSVPMAWGTVGMVLVQGVHTLGEPALDVFNQVVWGGYDYKQNKFIDVKTDPSFKDGMKFWNDAWNRGILDRESVTDDYDPYVQKLTSGRLLSGYYAVWDTDKINKEFADAGKPYRYIPMPIMLESQVARGDSKCQFTFSPSAFNSVAITKNAKYPERIMEVLDFIATEEGTLLYGWGEEGVQYTVENGKRIPTAEYYEKSKSDPNYTSSFGGPMGNAGLGFMNTFDKNNQMYAMAYDADVVMSEMDDKTKEVYAKYGWKNMYDVYRTNPKLKYDDTRRLDIKTASPTLTDDELKILEKIKTKSADYALKMVLAKDQAEFDKLMNELQKTTDDLGLPELIAKWDSEYKQLCDKFNITP